MPIILHHDQQFIYSLKSARLFDKVYETQNTGMIIKCYKSERTGIIQ